MLLTSTGFPGGKRIPTPDTRKFSNERMQVRSGRTNWIRGGKRYKRRW